MLSSLVCHITITTDNHSGEKLNQMARFTWQEPRSAVYVHYVPIWPGLKLDLLRDVADLIFNWAKFGMVGRPWDNVKTMSTGKCSDHRVNIGSVVSGKMMPDEYVIIIYPRNDIHFNVAAFIFTKIPECIHRCPNVPNTPNPPPWTINASIHIQVEPWIARLNCKQNGQLLVMAVMAILTNPKHLQHPPPLLVAPLYHETKLIFVDEHPPWIPTNSKRGSATPEAQDTMLHCLRLGMICLDRVNPLCNIKLPQAIRDPLIA
jgi:hypothetical protein